MNITNVIIRDVAKEDNQQLINLVHATLTEFGAKSGDGFAMDDAELLDMCKSYDAPKMHYFVIERDGKILGGAGVAPLEGEGNPTICELRKMYFSPELRGFGLGKKMIDKCITKAIEFGFKGMYLETINEMKAAQNLYKSRGFKYLDQRMGNTGHGACGVFMLKKLT